MAQKYYSSEEAAKLLGVTVDDVKGMLDRRELHGYRDGASWKFKVEDIQALATKRQSEPSESPEDEPGGDVLLSEVAIGQSDMGASGTVIAMDGAGQVPSESNVAIAGSDIKQRGDSAAPPARKEDEVKSKVTEFEEMSLSLDEDFPQDDSSVTLRNMPIPGASVEGGSAIDLGGAGLEDDDLVLGGSGTGSDISIGGDSGISLVDPSDSGLSLEQPLDLSGASGESLELDEDEKVDAAEQKTDDDFLLTPLDEVADAEGSESGSQVIALDTEEDAAISTSGGVSMAAMLDEDLSAQPGLEMGMGEPMVGAPLLSGQPGGLSEGAPSMQSAAGLPEAPYSGLQIAGLVACVVLLMLCGMMMYDLLRNMWSWEGPYTVNSSLMDAILGLFG